MSGIPGKLVAVAVRQLAKPISLTIKAQAIQHPRFRRSCIYIAQSLHTIDVRLRMTLLGQNKTKIRPLNDRKAIEDGATFLAEFFVFSVGGGVIIYEAWRSKKKQNERTEAIEDDIRILQDEIEFIKKRLSEYHKNDNLKLDDYAAPKDLKPKILKTVVNEEVDNHKEMMKKIESLERKYKELKNSQNEDGE